jgi:hypothetical protein
MKNLKLVNGITKTIAFVMLFLFSVFNYVQAEEVVKKKTYTWFLNKPVDSKSNIPKIQDWDIDADHSKYLTKSTVLLNTSITYDWASNDHAEMSMDKYVMARTKPTLEYIPQNYYEQDFGYKFQHWAYIKKFIMFGGSAGEGTILAPDPALIDQGHKAGVKVYGTVFLPPEEYGGTSEDAEAITNTVLTKLKDIAEDLNFDGWLLNIESPSHYSFESKIIRKRIRDFIYKNSTENNIEFIAYAPSGDSPYFISGGITDDDISNMAFVYNDAQTDVNIWHMKNRFTNKSYLLQIDEPVWNILKPSGDLKDHTARCLSKYNAIDKVFNGSIQGTEVWKGIKYYTKKADLGNFENKNVCLSDSYVNLAPLSTINNVNDSYEYNMVNGYKGVSGVCDDPSYICRI